MNGETNCPVEFCPLGSLHEQGGTYGSCGKYKGALGDALDAGFSVVPDVLLRYQSRLGLTPLDVVIILNICLHWWTPKELPFPRLATIGARIGLSPRSVERRIIAMEKKRLLLRLAAERHDALTIRRFDLSGLVKELQSLARADQAYAARQEKRMSRRSSSSLMVGEA